MTDASSLNSSEPNPLDPIIAAYLEAVERGDKPDRDRLVLDLRNWRLNCEPTSRTSIESIRWPENLLTTTPRSSG